MPSTSAVPSNTLTIINPAPPPGVTGTPPNRFILFTQEWLDLQNYVQAALMLPITKNDFKTTYGDFPKQQVVTDAVSAMKDVRDLSSTFGDPFTLKQAIHSDPNYLNGTTPPTQIYAHIVWLANQIYNASTTFEYTLPALAQLLGTGTPAERAANLRLILVGPGGLVSTANDMKTKTNALLVKLTDFDGHITSANTRLQTYTGAESDLLASANKIIGADQSDIDNRLRPAANEAYQKWRDYTIAAVTTSVGIMVISGGMLWPVAAGLAGGLGAAAKSFRDTYNDLMDEIAAKQVDIQQKTHLVTDLKGFNTQANVVGPALSTFKTSLQTIEGVWVDIAANLAFVANNYGVDQLSSLPWVMQALKIGDAQNKWHNIGTTAQEFTQHSLISYDFSTKFGQKISMAA